MFEVDEDRIVWCWILRAGTASVRLGAVPRGIFPNSIAAKPMDDDPESHRVAGLINGLPEDQKFGFFDTMADYDCDYDPPRVATEKRFRKRMAMEKIVGFPRKYSLTYLSPPDEVYKPETDSERREREEFQKSFRIVFLSRSMR